MAQPRDEPDWLAAERDYDDDLFPQRTIPELFEASAKRHLDSNAQLYKGGVYDRSLAGTIPPAEEGAYAPLRYGEMRDIVRKLAAGFRELGLGPDDRIAIYADTRMEWAQTDFAALAAGCVVTTVYTDASEDTLRYLLADPGASAVVVENEHLLERVLAVEPELSLSTIVLVDRPDERLDREDVLTLRGVYDLGQEVFDRGAYDSWIDNRDRTDLATLVYTSGTTGDPKGVELTHWNIISNIFGTRRRLGPRPARDPDGVVVGPRKRTISFLPAAHILERTAGQFLMYASGATVGYAESPDTLPEDFRLLSPTTGASVPRVYERIFDNMREQASGSAARERIFEWAVNVARDYARADDPGLVLEAKHGLADRLVFSTVKERIGGEVEFLVSGGGSLSQDLTELFLGMGVPVVEGYGLTETAPVVSVNPPEAIRPGTMGAPVADVDARLDESMVEPDQFPDAEGPVGELLVDGPNVTDGYWNRTAETEAAFTDDVPASDASGESEEHGSSGRYFRTGDIVEATSEGYFRYKDRLKQLIVLSTGKNVAPGPIEDMFATSDRVEQLMVVGDERKFIGAVVVPNVTAVRRWADREGIDLPDDDEALCRDERVREWVGEAIEEANEDLERVERVKAFELVPREWTVENDLLTPSMKKKRRNIRNVHADAIERLYEERAVAEAD